MQQTTTNGPLATHLPRYDELTSLPLYMDQVTMVIDEALSPLLVGEERVITPAMINNYVKQKLIAAPEKKKYGRAQLARLVELSVLKQALSMQEVQAVLAAVDAEYGEEAGYDLFCERLEQGWAGLLGGRAALARSDGGAAALLDAAVVAVAAKLLIRRMIADE